MKLMIVSSLVLTLFYSCSSGHYRPETIDAKMSRFQAQTDSMASIPQFPILPEKLSVETGHRAPASLIANAESMPTEIPYSNKKLYFLSLFSQYVNLVPYSSTSISIVEACPQFHSALVSYYEKSGRPSATKKKLITRFPKDSSKWDDTTLAIYPELALPATNEGPTPTVADIIRKEGMSKAEETLQRSIDLHVFKLHNEVSELCEKGTSTNFYNFDNVITYVDQEPTFKGTPENMRILYKTMVFANTALLGSIDKSQSRAPASVGDPDGHFEIVTHRLKAPWAKDYFKKLEQERSKSHQP